MCEKGPTMSLMKERNFSKFLFEWGSYQSFENDNDKIDSQQNSECTSSDSTRNRGIVLQIKNYIFQMLYFYLCKVIKKFFIFLLKSLHKKIKTVSCELAACR